MNSIPLRSGLPGAVAQPGRILTLRRRVLHRSTPQHTTAQRDSHLSNIKPFLEGSIS